MTDPKPTTPKKPKAPKASKGPSVMLLTRTGEEIPFEKVALGQPFYSEGVFWTRTDTYAATDLRKLSWDSTPHECYGSCQFGRGDAPMSVERVAVSFQ